MVPKIFIRSANNYDMEAVSTETGLFCKDVSLAVQAERDEVDINTIVKRFGLTGKLPDDIRAPQYGDFTGVVDYQGALNAVIEADREFMRLPADLRYRFHNDPQALLSFVSNDENIEEARKLGLLKPLPERLAPLEVRVVPDPPPTP